MFVTPAAAQTEQIPNPPGATVPLAGDAGVAHGEVVHVEGEHGGFPPFNSEYFPSQLLWLAISFGVFYLVLQKVILPRIGGIIENRRDRIALDLEAAERMKADADEALAAYQQELAASRERSHKISLEARDAAKADADRERVRIEGEMAQKLEGAQARIAAIKTAALADVGQIAEDVAEAILGEVAGLEASRDEVANAVRSIRV